MELRRALFPACYADGKGNLYYVIHNRHAIRKLNLKKNIAEYIDNPEGYIPEEWSGIDKIWGYEDKLYLFEQNGDRMLEYSLRDQKSRCFLLNCGMHSCDNWAAFTVCNNVLFAFASYLNRIIKIELNSGELKKDSFPIDDIFKLEKKLETLNKGKNKIPCKLFSCGCRVDDDIWLFMEQNTYVLKYNLFSGECKTYSLPEEIRGCNYAVWKENIFYILSNEGNVYLWNPLKAKKEILFDSENRNYPYFSKLIVTDTNIWIMPYMGEDIYVVNLKDRGFCKYDRYPNDFSYLEDPNRSKYYEYTEDEENVYFAMHSANYVLCIERKSGKEKWIKPKEPELEEEIRYCKSCGMSQYDEFEFGIKGFFMAVEHREECLYGDKKLLIGDLVWNRVKA